MENLLQDLRYSLRMLRKNPGFTVVAVVALALGIGANSAIFSVVNAVLLRPLPFKQPERLVRIWGSFEQHGIPKNWISQPELIDLKERCQSFEDIAAYQSSGVNLTDNNNPFRANAVFANASLFPILGVQASVGRAFSEDEDQPGRDRVALLSHGLWQRRYGGNPALVGQTIAINGESYTVVGVAPQGFDYPKEVDLWIPIAIDKANLANRGNHGLEVIARVKPGVTTAQANSELASVAAALSEQYPNNYPPEGLGLYLVPMLDELVGNFRPALMVLLGAVMFVLLIACANVANLLLARATAREREVSIRAALGAGRGRLIRQLLTESVLLAVIGGLVGVGLAYLGVKSFVAFGPRDIPRLDQIGLDMPVLGFSLLITIATGLIFGLAPALHISRPNLNESLKEGGRGSTGGHNRLRNSLVVLEVATALVLLIGAGLMIKSFARLLDINLGYRSENILTMRLALPVSKYKEDAQIRTFYSQLLDHVKHLPGVESAGAISHLPLSGTYGSGSTAVEDTSAGEGLQRNQQGYPYIEADRRVASPDYFTSLGISLKSGRLFTEADNENAPPVVVVDEMFERRFWPEGSAVGKRVLVGGTPQKFLWGEIVGVVGHVRHYGVDQVKQYKLGLEGREQIYFPYLQRPAAARAMYIAVRTTVEPLSLTGAVRNEVLSLDPDQPIFAVNTMDQLVATSFAQRQLNMLLFAVFSVIALVLAAVGIYGVMSYSVTQRTHEIGIRMALGAQQRGVLGLIVRQGMSLALAGVGVGLVAAFALTRVMASLLYGVSATDPVTFAAISLVLTGVALAACFVPARRATRVDPMIALRYE